jgi:succinate-semialdehyde dehydrogenase/glutarate-semialdehyde dehydrogenase
VETAASAAVWGAFSNSGQACASVERCYIHESIARQFIASVVKKTQALKQNVGTTEDTDLGAMSSERQLALVEEHVEGAVARGAQVLSGGRRSPKLSGSFYEPTVITGVDHSMPIMREETFGPVLPLMTFKTDEEAVRLANDSVFGLTASVWTKNARRGKRIALQLEAGTVMVNEVLYTHGIAQTPWGGMKQSGLGRTHGRLGLLELVAPQHVHINRIARVRDFWWFNYTPDASRLFRGFARRFATGNIAQTSLLLPQMVRRLFERKPRQ